MTAASVRLLVVGASGRMGRAFMQAAARWPDLTIVAGVVLPEDPAMSSGLRVEGAAGPVDLRVVDDGSAYLDECDLVVEFAHPSATARYARGAAEAGRGFLSGTTGLDAAARAALEEASRVVPVLHSPNMSPGVAVLADIAAEAARRLGPDYDVEIIESHHRGKADAPSGTALTLAEAVGGARGGARLVHGRQGRTGPRSRDEIGIHAVRAGEIVGRHTVLLAGPGEWIELTHCALSRACFAEGAVRAVRFLVSAPPGLYGMADLIGAPLS